MSVKQSGSAPILDGGYVDTDKLGTDKGSPQGKKFLTDDQAFSKVKAEAIDSEAATAGQLLTANGSGGATWV